MRKDFASFLHGEMSYNENIVLITGDLGYGLWDKIKPESIDYGLLEKSNNIYVVTANFKWNDVGSWRALYDVLNPNDEGNIIRPDFAGFIRHAAPRAIKKEPRKFTEIILSKSKTSI